MSTFPNLLICTCLMFYNIICSFLTFFQQFFRSPLIWQVRIFPSNLLNVLPRTQCNVTVFCLLAKNMKYTSILLSVTFYFFLISKLFAFHLCSYYIPPQTSFTCSSFLFILVPIKSNYQNSISRNLKSRNLKSSRYDL